MAAILEVLKKGSFIESVILLLITAIVANFLVPHVTARLDQDKFERQKLFEDELSRRTKLREDRIKLLDEIESLLWEYQSLLLEPSYFAIRRNDGGFKKIFQQYDEKAPVLLSAIRAKISKLSRLAKPETHQRFRELFHSQLIELDSELISLGGTRDLTRDKWVKHHERAYITLTSQIERALLLLANDFGFTPDKTETEVTKKAKS